MVEMRNSVKRCPHYMCTYLQNFSSLPPAVLKLSAKVFIFDFFQDPCSVDSFPDHLVPFKTITLKYTVLLGSFKTITLDYTVSFHDHCTG